MVSRHAERFRPRGGGFGLGDERERDGAPTIEASGVPANAHPTLLPVISTEKGYNMASTADGEEAGWTRERERRP